MKKNITSLCNNEKTKGGQKKKKKHNVPVQT
jgi:hypothetical protein